MELVLMFLLMALVPDEDKMSARVQEYATCPIEQGYISFVVGDGQQSERARGITTLNGLAVGEKLYFKDVITKELYVFEVIEKITEK